MTKKQIQELLEKLNAELKAEIELSQSGLKEARSLVKKINNLLGKAANLVAELEDPESGVGAKLSKSTEDTTVISAAVRSATELLETIQGHVEKVQQNVAEMESAYAAFQTVKANINDPNTGFDALLTTARQYKAQVQASATQAANLEAQIRQNLAAVQENITTMRTAYDDFATIKTQIDDPDSGLEAVLDASQSLKDEIAAINKDSQTLYKEISRYKDQAAKNAASIQAIQDKSGSVLETIRQHEIESEETKERISKIFELVSQTGHANYFDSRRKRLVFASWGWLIAGIVALVIAVILATQLLLPLLPVPDPNTKTTGTKLHDVEIGVLVLRTFIITPVIAFVIYAFNQYGKERKLAEQYAFKSVSASTIEGSIALIERSLKSVPSEHLNTQLADFAIQTAHSLHAEPQELQKLSKFSFNIGSKLAGVGAEINDTLGSINRELKKAIAKNTDTE